MEEIIFAEGALNIARRLAEEQKHAGLVAQELRMSLAASQIAIAKSLETLASIAKTEANKSKITEAQWQAEAEQARKNRGEKRG